MPSPTAITTPGRVLSRAPGLSLAEATPVSRADRIPGMMLRILTALRDDGDWMSRRQLAAKIRKGSLMTYHIQLLDAPNECRLVEAEMRETRRGAGYQDCYRVTARGAGRLDARVAAALDDAEADFDSAS